HQRILDGAVSINAAIAVISYSLFPSFSLFLLPLYGSPIRSTYRGGKEGEKGIGDHCNCCNGHHAATVYSLRPVDPSRASFFRLAASHRLATAQPARLVYVLLRPLPPAAALAHPLAYDGLPLCVVDVSHPDELHVRVGGLFVTRLRQLSLAVPVWWA